MVLRHAGAALAEHFENIAYGRRLKGERDRERLEHVVESALRAAILWDEVKDRLGTRRCGSRGAAAAACASRARSRLDPEVILLDEPCSGLDPISTLKIEEALAELKSAYSIVRSPTTRSRPHGFDEVGFFSWASWSSTARRGRSSPSRATGARTTTSRGGSARS